MHALWGEPEKVPDRPMQWTVGPSFEDPLTRVIPGARVNAISWPLVHTSWTATGALVLFLKVMNCAIVCAIPSPISSLFGSLCLAGVALIYRSPNLGAV
ncbi:hypothetical protein [Pandoravirus japonicus]|uniref:Uncharacterized protein n=1 Tax=Pandoravirus japonicus TaxID=2823154 RepID=A0A811BQ06_9VIRU|nr:hypothetical protein [Pandoravirus japonicus]